MFTESSVSSFRNKRNMQHGGLGAVSVYFYKAKVLNSNVGISERNDTFVDYDDIDLLRVPKTRRYQEIGVTTSFGVGVKYEQSKHLRKLIKPLTKLENSLIAVLHLHYRPYEWFIGKNFGSFNVDIFSHENASILKEKSEENVKRKAGKSSIIKEEKMTIKVKDSLIFKEEKTKANVEDNEKLIITKQENNFQSQSSIALGKRKRKSSKYREIVEIIDSDEDHEIINLDEY